MLKPVPPEAAASAGHPPHTLDGDLTLARLPQRVYRFRLLGMGLGALCIAAVLSENGAPAAVWAFWAFTGLAWPHLAYLFARRSGAPYRAELRNLLADSALAGLWVPLMDFNLLPSVLLLTLVTVDKISTGIPRLWLWSLPVMAAAVLAGGLLTGFAFRPATSMAVMLACLPMLLIHTIAVSLASNLLIHKIRDKNHQLDVLSRTDTLTGLNIRRHWQQLAVQALQRHRRDETPATLMMLDVDDFKRSNDVHGHAVGDEVLRAVAQAIRRHVGEDGAAGRYGGDEFGVVLTASGGNEARFVAEQIRREVEAIRLPAAPQARCTISIGLAEATRDHATLEQWLERADSALYRAKHAGRNQVATAAAAERS